MDGLKLRGLDLRRASRSRKYSGQFDWLDSVAVDDGSEHGHLLALLQWKPGISNHLLDHRKPFHPLWCIRKGCGIALQLAGRRAVRERGTNPMEVWQDLVDVGGLCRLA